MSKIIEEEIKMELDIMELIINNMPSRVLNTFKYEKIRKALEMLYFFVKFPQKVLRTFVVHDIMHTSNLRR